MTDKSLWSGTLAILADPHMHDLYAGKDFNLAVDDTFRSLADTASSTRIFNEAGPALHRALDLIAERGIRLVLIPGDLTDDGQRPNWRAAASLLSEHSRRYGTRFLMVPGNHDQWMHPGERLSKGMVLEDGQTFQLSGVACEAGSIHSPEMVRNGHETLLEFAGDFGFCRSRADLHWETPYGRSDALTDRIGTAVGDSGLSVSMPDMSYLVEPEKGLWILAIDASVYLPEGAGWQDCGKEGWIAAVRHRALLLDWVTDVAHRAKVEGKRLVTMSHFPALDVMAGVPLGLSERIMPGADVVARMASTGMGLHFSGHWHVNRTGSVSTPEGWLVNVAVPSTAGYPAAFKIARISGDRAEIETVGLGDTPGFDSAFGRYRCEDPMSRLPQAKSYDDFLAAHLAGLVSKRYLPRDWGSGFDRKLTDHSLYDIAALTGVSMPEETRDIGGLTAISDFYALERAGSLARIDGNRRALYLSLPDHFGASGHGDEDRLISGLSRYAKASADDGFVLDFNSGRIDT